jgi:hypothetical protein
LCHYHHTGRAGIHFDKEMDDKLKRFAQKRFEAVYSENFKDIFGKNFNI